MKKENYFKRLKKKNKNHEEAKEIFGETKTYLFISIGTLVTFALLSYLVEAIEALSNILMAVAVIGMLASIFFGLNLYATKRGIQRLKNLICDKCGAQLGDPENTTYEEVSHYWSDSSNSKRAASKLYVTVKFTFKCPKCGAVKSFNETLCSGEVSASNYSTNDTTVSTEKLVNDYLMGKIHF